MHTRSRNTKLRLSHKGRIQTVLTSNSFHNQLENLNLITSTKHFVILKVNLVLANCYLMVTSFYFKAHLGQDIDDFPTSIICQVCRRQVKITTLVIYFQRRVPIFIQLKRKNSGSGPRLKDLKPSSSICLRARLRLLRGSPRNGT